MSQNKNWTMLSKKEQQNVRGGYVYNVWWSCQSISGGVLVCTSEDTNPASSGTCGASLCTAGGPCDSPGCNYN